MVSIDNKRSYKTLSIYTRRIVIQNNQDGKAAIYDDDQLEIKPWTGADAGDAVVWSTRDLPVKLTSDDFLDNNHKVGVTMDGGSVFRITELGPGFATPMHRTLSLDYCVVLSGVLEAVLDSGVVTRLCPGEVYIQRGTNHSWRNPDKHYRCRFMVCMLEAQPVAIGKAKLKPTPMWRMVAATLWAMINKKNNNNSVASSIIEKPTVYKNTIRQVVSTHDSNAKSLVFSDRLLTLKSNQYNTWLGAMIWSAEVIADNSVLAPVMNFTESDFHKGFGLFVDELLPGTMTNEIHTASLDYCVIMEGNAELILNSGEITHLQQGDTIIQKEAAHRFKNTSTDMKCRIITCRIQTKTV